MILQRLIFLKEENKKHGESFNKKTQIAHKQFNIKISFKHI